MANDIRRRIMRGNLSEGQALPPEADLMAEYSVSRPTVRETLRILESESLIVIRRGGHGGAIIKRPNLDVAVRYFGLILQDREVSVADVYAARTAVEPPAIGDLARKAGDVEIETIRRKLDQTDELVGSLEDYVHAMSDLREYMITAAGNITLSLLSRMLNSILDKYTVQTGTVHEEEWAHLQRRNQRSLRRLLTYIEAHDALAAEKFWRVHLDNIGKHLFDSDQIRKVIDLLE